MFRALTSLLQGRYSSSGWIAWLTYHQSLSRCLLLGCIYILRNKNVDIFLSYWEKMACWTVFMFNGVGHILLIYNILQYNYIIVLWNCVAVFAMQFYDKIVLFKYLQTFQISWGNWNAFTLLVMWLPTAFISWEDLSLHFNFQSVVNFKCFELNEMVCISFVQMLI